MLHATIRSSKGETNEPFTRQGSLRRVLPSEHNKENIFGRQNEDINMFYKVVHQEYIILAEYKMLVSENLKGIYVIPSKENSFVWFGVVFVRSGLYEDGVFRFSIILPESFPDGEHPKVVFQSEVYHPVIHRDTNELYLLNGFPVWNKGEQHIWQILKYIQWNFHHFDASLAHSINEEDVDLYKNNVEAFKEKVRQCVKQSQDELYAPPPTTDKHYIAFEKYIPELHDPVRAAMITQGHEERPAAAGHSWVTPGSFKPLSRAPSPVSDSDT